MFETNSKKKWISTLFSTAIHLMLLLVLAISSIVIPGRGERSIISSMKSGEDTSLTILPEVEFAPPTEQQNGLGSDAVTTSLYQDSMDVPLVDSSEGNISPPTTTISEIAMSSGTTTGVGANGFVSTSIDSRKPENRKIVGAKNGATPQSEAAVNLALAFLARNQESNGSWTMALTQCPDCTEVSVGLDDHRIAATGLSLLCFLGAGHTLTEGEYNETVRKGVYFLIQAMKYKGDPDKIYYAQGYWLTEVAPAQMYEHGIATLALTEAYQMSNDSSIKDPCQAAINFIIDAQYKRDGGWDYHPRRPGDLSIVGWQIMALKSASSAKLSVPQNVLRDSDKFLESQALSNGYQFGYRGGPATASMTSIGNLIRLFRGYSVTDPTIRRANDWIAKQAPSVSDVYYNYYATQFMFHVGGDRWKNWNAVMRELLIHSQTLEGPMAGSWFFDGNTFNLEKGRLYTTTMSCLTLEVYYRYLPVYEASGDDFRL
ncbi:MAG: hypothetical protein MUC43_12070 [Pirellula sp.]|nr:hypothetical protein [Pirellula sp.]